MMTKINRSCYTLIFVALTLAFTFILSLQVTALAAEDDTDSSGGVLITVVVPTQPIYEEDIQATTPTLPYIYPISVWESRENDRREIIRVYELRDNECTTQIPRGAFEREGFLFELGEIVKRDVPNHSTREHVETITVSTQTNDLATVLQLLSPTIEHMTEDGYFGILTLDISSITIESQGTRSSNHTETRTREFPHLSNADTSLVPRTITENGRTYNLANVEWRTQSTTPIDYRQIPSTFTAVATFTRNATRTSTIGYSTTAVYSGQLSRIAVGRTEFTVNFIGIPIVMPAIVVHEISAPYEYEYELPESDTEIAEHAPSILYVEQVHIGGIVIETETPLPAEETICDETDGVFEETNIEDESTPIGFQLGYVVIFVLFIGAVILAYFIGKKGKALLAPAKKLSCLVLCIGLVLGVSQTAYAVHFNPNHNRYFFYSSEHTPMEAVHFNPQVRNAPEWGNPIPHHPLQNVPNTYNYGDFLGYLIVERLGRRVGIFGGATMASMDHGAAHFSFTGLNQGTTGLIGHNRGRNNGFFDFVRHLQYGDILILEAGGVTRKYAVAMRYIICETDFTHLKQFKCNRLTLITCLEYQRSKRRAIIALEIFPNGGFLYDY